MINFTLRQLRYVDALARHGHFGRAADACAVSQPALSVQIRELEATLGLPLFERATRQVRVTAFGEEFILRARDILRAAGDLGDLARAAQTGLQGRFRIGVIPTIAPYLLPRVLAGLGQSHAGLDVHVRETVTERLVAELTEGRIDAAIVALPIAADHLTTVALFDEPMVLVRAMGDGPLPRPTRDSLMNLRLLLLEEGHCFRDQALSFCNLPGKAAPDGLDGSSLSTLVQMVGAGIGATLIPQMAVAVETRSAPVQVAHFEDPQPMRTIGVIWRKTNPLADQLAQVARIVKDAA